MSIKSNVGSASLPDPILSHVAPIRTSWEAATDSACIIEVNYPTLTQERAAYAPCIFSPQLGRSVCRGGRFGRAASLLRWFPRQFARRPMGCRERGARLDELDGP